MYRLFIASIRTRYRFCILLAAISSFAFSTAASQPLDTMWQRTFGGANEDYVRFFISTNSTGCLIGGLTENHLNWEDEDALAYKLDSSGTSSWVIRYGIRENREYFTDAWTMPDGGFLLFGSQMSIEFTDSMNLLIRVSEEGDTLWTRSFRFQLPDSASVETIQLTSEGKLLLGGCSRNTHWGNCDIFYMLADTLGDSLWTRQYTDSISDFDIIPTNLIEIDDGFIVAGSGRLGMGNDVFLLETDSLGMPNWFQRFDIDTSDDVLANLRVKSDGGFLVAGWSQFYNSDDIRGLVISFNSEGDTIWSRLCGSDNWWEEFSDAIETQDGGVLAVGRKEWDHDGTWTSFDVWVVKLDSAGTVEWEATYGLVRGDDNAIGVYQLPDGGFLIGGQSDVVGARPDFLVIRTWPEGWNATDETELHPVEFKLMQNYPNPFNSETKIEFALDATAPVTLTVFDLLGREVKQLAHGTLAAGRYSYYFRGNELPSGVYLYRLQAGSCVSTKKMVLLK